jgi:hypothetical protein
MQAASHARPDVEKCGFAASAGNYETDIPIEVCAEEDAPAESAMPSQDARSRKPTCTVRRVSAP